MPNDPIADQIVAELFIHGILNVEDLKSARAVIEKIITEKKNEPT